jgi:dihydrofolate synthase/folylpolyglutamate synthase
VVDSPLYGPHQIRNIALAIAAADELDLAGVKITPRDVETGIRQTRWPGRFEVIPADREHCRPEIVLDVAHNPAGAWALRSVLSERYLQTETPPPLVFVFGAMRDKAIAEIAQILFPLAQHVVLTRARNPRSAEPSEIRHLAEGITNRIREANDISSAAEEACSLAGPSGVVVVTGSIYVVGDVLAILLPRKERPGASSRAERDFNKA